MSREILNKLLHLKTFINKKLPEAAITISTPILMSDKGKAVMTSWQLTYHPISLKIDILINRNITGKHLSCSEFHLSESGINFLTKSLVSNLQKLWWSLEYLNNLYQSPHFSKSLLTLIYWKEKNIS